jgi:hypothetical protein
VGSCIMCILHQVFSDGQVKEEIPDRDVQHAWGRNIYIYIYIYIYIHGY